MRKPSENSNDYFTVKIEARWNAVLYKSDLSPLPVHILITNMGILSFLILQACHKARRAYSSLEDKFKIRTGCKDTTNDPGPQSRYLCSVLLCVHRCPTANAFSSFPWLLPTTDQSCRLTLKSSVNWGYSILCSVHSAILVSLEYFAIAGTMCTANFISIALTSCQNSAS